MKGKAFLVFAVLAIFLSVLGVASAGEIARSGSIYTEFNGVGLGPMVTMAGVVGDTVPVRVTFDSAANLSDVRVKVRMEGHREEVSASSERFDVIDGVTYTKLISLELPSDEKTASKEYTLYVEISSAHDRSEEQYTLKIQRESYSLDILSVDYPTQVSAGSIVPISVVIKNTGYNRLDDAYVVASIAALGISSRVYVGDLVAIETPDLDNEEDSAYGRVYLQIPETASNGVYDLEIVAYNADAKTKVVKKISIKSLAPEKKPEEIGEGKKEGTETITTGKTVDEEQHEEDSTSVVALTVVLVIIFVVLLAVLVVLLTKKEKPAEEVETSYY
ncbi:hypothetical protein D6829_00635 [Candidatus Pacearchaeota archaeon]|nr:MAG: hypothetical protein D6829_00635 [Candidatus Pacearchaeota archaeon]